MTRLFTITALAFVLALLPASGQTRQPQTVRIVLDVKSTDASVIARQQAYLEKYQADYARQLTAVREDYPLVYAHLRLLQLAELNLLTDASMRRSLSQVLSQPVYRTPYAYAQTLSKSELSPLLLRDARTVAAIRKCGSPCGLVWVKVNLEGTLTEERGFDDALQVWADCIRRR